MVLYEKIDNALAMVLLREKDLYKFLLNFHKTMREIPGFTWTKLFIMLDESQRNYLVEDNMVKFIKRETQ